VVKFRLEEGAPAEQGRLGLAAHGVSVLYGETMVFENEDHGFLFDFNSGQALELDLAEMTILGSQDLGGLLDPAMPTYLGFNRFVADEDEQVGVTYATDIQQEMVSETAQIVFLDPSTGTHSAVTSPCGGVQYGAHSASGDLLFASDPWVAAIHAIDPERAPAPCMIRIPRDTHDAAPEVVYLDELTGRPTGGLIPAGDGMAYLRVLDTDTYPIGPETTAIELFGVPFWETWLIDLDDPTSATKLDRELIAGGITFFEADGGYYENVSAADFSSSMLARTSSTGSSETGLEVPGVPFSVVELGE